MVWDLHLPSGVCGIFHVEILVSVLGNPCPPTEEKISADGTWEKI
jgi:hypothetical protein